MRDTGTPAWTVIFVPPNPTASPKRVGMKIRTARRILLVILVAVAVPWLWTFAATHSAGQMADRLAEEQRLTVALTDTVASLRAASLAELAKKQPPVGMLMPLSGEITSRFTRSRFHPILQVFRAHRGVDLAAPSGTRILAPAKGTVLSVDREFGFGLMVEIQHSGGVVTRYAHLRSALVQRGDTVSMGQSIALVGSSGLATAPHLHFEVLVKGKHVDPVNFIASTHVVPDSTVH
jgi:murein DD-endopeptidase MepM/ murein hydrolase activator NlpD